jgi:hypothetical protein
LAMASGRGVRAETEAGEAMAESIWRRDMAA